jgi:tRNA pseudouridine38-40 synthase
VRLRIDLAYDGTAFHGWAKQTDLRTVQGELENALDTVLRTEGTTLVVAGRTDTGVHARHQVIHFDLAADALVAAAGRSAETPFDALRRRVNGVIGEDVRLHRVAEAPPGFDARFSAIWRRYAYRVADRAEWVDPLERSHVLTWQRELDLDAMNTAAGLVLGLQDFASFCKRREGATTIRTLLGLYWERIDGLAVANVRADAFCHSMVRSLVGCLLAVGDGRRPVDWPAEVLEARARDGAVTVVQARGLTLEQVAYAADADLASQAESTRALRSLDED